MRLNKSSGSAGKRNSMTFKIACHSAAGDGGKTEGLAALVISSRSRRGTGSRSGRSLLSGSGALWRSRKSRRHADAEHLFPARPRIRSLAVQRAVNHQPRHFLYDLFEIEFRDAVALEIRRWIQEVDGVGHPVLDGELDGVHFVAQRLVDGLRLFHDARADVWRQVLMVDKVPAFFWIIVNGNNVGLAESKAAHVLIEIDEFLKCHAIRRSLVIGCEKFLFVMHFVDVLPAAARKRFQNGGPAHVIKQPLPVHWILPVVPRPPCYSHTARGTLLRQHN